MIRILLAVVVVGVAGCGLTPEGRARRAERERAAEQAMIAQDEGTCSGYGFVRGTPAYAQCRMQIDTNRAQAGAAHRANSLAIARDAFQSMQPVQPARPVQTQCNRFGNQVNCTSY